MLGGFHTAKCLEHCVGKYIKGIGIEDCLSQTNVIGVKTIKSVFDATNYTRSLKGFFILSHAIEKLKWEAFMKSNVALMDSNFLHNVDCLTTSLSSNECLNIQENYKNCIQQLGPLKQKFDEFSKSHSEKSEMCKYWDGVIYLTEKLKNFKAADREGNCDAHLQAIQDILPIFCESDHYNYQRYGSIYLEKMRKLPSEHPSIYKEFKGGNFVVKTNKGYFNAVGADMKLEQKIQRSKKGSGGEIGQTKNEGFVTEWEIVYHEILSISKLHKDVTGSLLTTSDATTLHKELTQRKILEYNEAVTEVFTFMNSKGNPYLGNAETKLYHFISGELVSDKAKERLLQYFDHSKKEYSSFRKERFISKEKSLSYSIKRVNLPSFLLKVNDQKNTTQTIKSIEKLTMKKMSKCTKDLDIAKKRGFQLHELLIYDHLEENVLFEKDELRKPNKSILIQTLEASYLEHSEYNFKKDSKLNTAIIVDFMSVIRKIPLQKFKSFQEALEFLWCMILRSHDNLNRIDIVYDSYIENSIKDSERRRRSRNIEPIEYVNLCFDKEPPADLKRFWISPENKRKLQLLSRDFFQQKAEKNKDITFILSGYVTDNEGIKDCLMVKAEKITTMKELNSSIEEADCRIIPHTIHAAKSGKEKVIIYSNDTDVAVYAITYMSKCKSLNCNEVWLLFGSGEKSRYLPIHTLAYKMGYTLSSSILLKVHVLTGCDVTSKLGTKPTALKSSPENYLESFGVGEASEISFQQAEKYLVNVLQRNSGCSTFSQ